MGQASNCVLDVDRIMVPIHLPAHWVSAVIDMEHQCVIYLDSMGVIALCLELLPSGVMILSGIAAVPWMVILHR